MIQSYFAVACDDSANNIKFVVDQIQNSVQQLGQTLSYTNDDMLHNPTYGIGHSYHYVIAVMYD